MSEGRPLIIANPPEHINTTSYPLKQKIPNIHETTLVAHIIKPNLELGSAEAQEIGALGLAPTLPTFSRRAALNVRRVGGLHRESLLQVHLKQTERRYRSSVSAQIDVRILLTGG